MILQPLQGRGAGTQGVLTQGMGKRFGRTWALRDVTLTIAPASVVLLIGPNGSGKTTLLRVLATALRPSAGRGWVYGHDLLTEAGRVRRLTVFVASGQGAYERLTARENLRFAAAMSGTSEVAVPFALDSVGLGGVADRPVRTFSQGMKRRLALGRARLQQPSLLLLDEPFNGLDADGVGVAGALIDEVKLRGGVVLIATHEWERAIHLADYVVRLADGRQLDVEERPRPPVDARGVARAVT